VSRFEGFGPGVLKWFKGLEADNEHVGASTLPRDRGRRAVV
jgi:hypothetical protein